MNSSACDARLGNGRRGTAASAERRSSVGRRAGQRQRSAAAPGLGLAPLALLGACGGAGGGGTNPIPAPVLTSREDSVSIQVGTAEASGNVLSNDSATKGGLVVSSFTTQTGIPGVLGQPFATIFGSLTLNANGSFTAAVANTAAVQAIPGGFVANTSFLYIPTAGSLTGAPQTLVISVIGINDAPVVRDALPNLTVNEGNSLMAGLPGTPFTDPDIGSTLTLSARLASGAPLPSWLTFDAATGVISATPGFADSGTYAIQITATDDKGASASQIFTLEVPNVITGVVADGYLRSATVFLDLNGDGDISTGEPFAFTGSDGRFNLVSEQPGKLVAINGISTDTGVVNTVTMAALAGSSVINPLTTLVHALVQSGQTADQAQASVRTAFGLSAAIDLNHFDILAQPSTSSIAIAAQKAAASIAALLTQIEAPSGNSAANPAEAAGLAQLAAMVGSATGPIDLASRTTIAQIFTATGLFDAAAIARYAFGVATTNQAIASATSLESIASAQAIAGKNKLPVALDDDIAATEDQDLVFDVRQNDSDPDGGSLSVVAINGVVITPGVAVPIKGSNVGTITVGSNGAFTFHPNPNATGLAVFDYTLSDGQGGVVDANVALRIADVPDAPIANNDAGGTVKEDGLNSVVGNVLANDTDADSVSPVIVGTVAGAAANVGQPVRGIYGSITIDAIGNYAYTLDNADPDTQALVTGQSVNETFIYQATDGQASSSATLTITVTGVNDAPVAVDDTGFLVTEDAATTTVAGNVLTNDTDADAGATRTVLSVAGVTANVGQAAQGLYGSIIVNADGSFVYTLDNADPDTEALAAGQTAADAFVYAIADGTGGSATATIRISVAGAPNPITGTAGSDALVGTSSPDILSGLAGNDVLSGLGGADTLDGGDGTDTASYAAAPAGVTVILTNPSLNSGDAAGDAFVGIEHILGSGFADLIIGDSGANMLSGGGGNDRLAGGGGIDVLDGGLGDDTIAGGPGGDQIEGGDGFDQADYSTSSVAVSIDLGNLVFQGGDAVGDVISNIEGLIGSDFADTFIGGAANDSFFGGYGTDTLTGGAGADAFMFDLLLLVNGEADTITDFQKGVDQLRFLGGDIDETFTFVSGANPVASGSDPTYLYNTSTGMLSYSSPAYGLREIAVFTNLPPLDASDIVVI